MDRSNGKLHGGLICHIKDGVAFNPNKHFLDSDIEAMWIEINLPKTKPILIGTVYRPPSSHVDYVDKLDTIFHECNSTYDDVYILGDFNLDVAKTSECKRVNILARNSQMTQIIKDYTIIITNVSKSKIDLIFVSRAELVVSSGVHSLGLSDHCSVNFCCS